MKTTIIEILLLLLLIVSGGILYTLDKNTQGDKQLQQYIDTNCVKTKTYFQNISNNPTQNMNNFSKIETGTHMSLCGTILGSHAHLFVTKTHRK